MYWTFFEKVALAGFCIAAGVFVAGAFDAYGIVALIYLGVLGLLLLPKGLVFLARSLDRLSDRWFLTFLTVWIFGWIIVGGIATTMTTNDLLSGICISVGVALAFSIPLIRLWRPAKEQWKKNVHPIDGYGPEMKGP